MGRAEGSIIDTLTTIEAVERTASGAFRITLLGDVVAGTRDEEIGALAERLAGDDEANPVGVKLEKLPNGKVLIKEMTEITEPDLDAAVAATVVPEAVARAEAESPVQDDESPAQDDGRVLNISEAEVHALALEAAASYIRGLQS